MVRRVDRVAAGAVEAGQRCDQLGVSPSGDLPGDVYDLGALRAQRLPEARDADVDRPYRPWQVRRGLSV